jgi:hypothetical protein
MFSSVGESPDPSQDCVYPIDLADAAGVVHAEVDKTIYVRRRSAV